MVSIIMPVHNSEKYIQKSIKSVLNQTYKNLELLVVDDGSCDNSINIVQRIAGDDDRIRIIRILTNQGAANARNIGITHAIGDYVLFLDSDDMLFPNAVSQLVKRIKETDADMVVGNYVYKYEERNKYIQGSFLRSHIYTGAELIDCMHFSCLMGTKLLRADKIFINNIKYPLLHMGEDLAFYNLFLSNCRCVATIIDNILIYRMYEGSTSKSYNLKTKDFIKAFEIVEKNYKEKMMYDFMNDFLYDEYFYIIGNIKRLPRYHSKRERQEIFDLFVKYASSKDTSQVSDESTLLLINEFMKIKQHRWLYTSITTTSIYKILRAIKHKIGGAKNAGKIDASMFECSSGSIQC